MLVLFCFHLCDHEERKGILPVLCSLQKDLEEKSGITHMVYIASSSELLFDVGGFYAAGLCFL